eukprot:gene28214-42442_t
MRLSKAKKQKTMEAMRPVGLIDMRVKLEQQIMQQCKETC